ncbi:hypothetical protein DI272_19125 [Streptomyces sp. Act143]|uniref:hypothetical protein n=1 Tax=Streptomyces sp. Act143 TaxID=2200760 RepID=UPI000D6731FA|nr:hypothetical protein [Streptomyces sp. Act143]PWI16044.1 hypothetical protein DI272_19125 [Streptomyces sp. Act143]
MIALALGVASWALVASAVTCIVTGRVTTGFGVLSLAYLVGAAGHAANGSPAGAAWDAGFAALFAWVWWNRGGGDGPRRRLRRWARKFHGVRRTAPMAGAA